LFLSADTTDYESESSKVVVELKKKVEYL